jgi:UDP-N-acetylmuramate dehydrogenase
LNTARTPIDDVAAGLSGIEHVRDVVLAKRTTFGIGGPADLLVTTTTDAEVVTVLRLARDHGVPVTVLGGGSNLLVADAGVRGVVLTLGGALASLRVFDDGKSIEVGAGVTYPRLTRTALDLGWPAAVGWMGTPGQVGGALKMNAGTRDGELGDVVVEVRAASADGAVTIARAECGFGYRQSKFSTALVLTSTLLHCEDRRSHEAEALDRKAKELLAKRHQSQPKLRSAGSIFKNPPGDFAGRLIEAAGLKGFSVGGAAISDVHANFVVNRGGARAADVLAVATHAQRVVQERFSVALEWEVRRIGDFDALPNVEVGGSL